MSGSDPAPGAPSPRPARPGRGFIALFARHRTAANLLMAIMVIAGLYGLYRMTTQFFPDFNIDIVSISVPWPGASAADVDRNIVQAIEPEVRFLNGVRRVRSSSFEGRASIVIEFVPGTDMQAALSSVETAVRQVTTLPEDSETPVIQRFVFYETLSRLVISGPYSERSLNEIARNIRNQLLIAGAEKVDIEGARDEEIRVEVAPAALRQMGLTLGDIAERIRTLSQDIPSGDLEGRLQRQLRSEGMRRSAREIGALDVRTLPDGSRVFLRDIANVVEEFDQKGKTVRRNGQRAIELHIQRSTTGDALKLADRVDAYLEELLPTLPPNLVVEQFNYQAELIRSRIALLLENGASGLVLVLLVLFVFLNFRVAVWVAVGIPVSLLATMLVMWLTGQSINMVSLFGLIMAIGIIVDDAIVVGEHSEELARRGYTAVGAAEQGARRMAVPVVSASLTTIAAFLPLMMISDVIGAIVQAIPLVVIAVLVASLVECFLILPGHMRHALSRERAPSLFRRSFDDLFGRFRSGPFDRAVRRAVRWRYATLATAIAAFVVALGLVAGGRLNFVFFASPEVDTVFANVEFQAGTPRETTLRMLERMEAALRETEAELTGGKGGLVRISIQRIGTAVGVAQDEIAMQGDHVGGLFVELELTDKRTVTSGEIVRAWRERVVPMAGVVGLSIAPARAGPPGRDIDVRFVGNDIAALKAASNELKLLLATMPGVSDIQDDLPYGKPELVLELTPHGKALGFTTETVGREIRNAFEGAIARRFARDDAEVLIRVRLPAAALDLSSLNDFHLKVPGAGFVPLDSVVTIRQETGFARIRRENGLRQVSVTTELDSAVATQDRVLAALRAGGIDEIARRHGVSYSFKGKAEEQATTFADMQVGALIGLALIYIILAWVFSSYARPIVVMSVIPLGFVGMTVGHLLLGYDLTIMSMIALIGVSGIVINDSIILVTTIHQRVESGEERFEAIVGGARDRLRAVILTSLTTVGGLTPLLFESSLQARFLIPMAVTIVFGLLFATLLVLFVIPALIAIQSDVGALLRRLAGRESRAAAAG